MIVWLVVDARDYYARPVLAVYDNEAEANRHADALGEAYVEDHPIRQQWDGKVEP